MGFWSGIQDGFVGAAEGTWEDVKALGKGGYELATNPEAREQAWEATKEAADSVADYAGEVYDEPSKLYEDAKDGALAAYSAAENFVETADAEDWGKLAGGGAFEAVTSLVPVGKVAKLGKLAKLGDAVGDAAKVVDKAGDVAKLAKAGDAVGDAAKALDKAGDAGKLAKAGDAVGDAAKTGDSAGVVDGATDSAKALSKTAPASVVPCKKKLGEHRAAVDAHEAFYKEKLREAEEAGSSSRVKGSYKARLTEAKGERATADYMEQNHPDAELVRGFQPGTGFDQVWVKTGPDGKITEFIIVEAKGPGAKLSTGALKGDQMSKQWVRETAETMAANSKDLETERLGNAILDAMDKKPPPSVTGKGIEAIEKNGEVIGAKEITLPTGNSFNLGVHTCL